MSDREAREFIALTYGMLTMVDDAVGRVLARLDALGLADDTVIAFTSDHGDWMGDHGIMLKGPLHYQGLLRVPFIWADPQQAEGHGAGPGSGQHRGQGFDGLASTIDIPATFLDRARLGPYNGIQGHSLLDTIADLTTGSVAGRTGLLIEEDALRSNFCCKERPPVRTWSPSATASRSGGATNVANSTTSPTTPTSSPIYGTMLARPHSRPASLNDSLRR